jgi:hypothetical protein
LLLLLLLLQLAAMGTEWSLQHAPELLLLLPLLQQLCQ